MFRVVPAAAAIPECLENVMLLADAGDRDGSCLGACWQVGLGEARLHHPAATPSGGESSSGSPLPSAFDDPSCSLLLADFQSPHRQPDSKTGRRRLNCCLVSNRVSTTPPSEWWRPMTMNSVASAARGSAGCLSAGRLEAQTRRGGRWWRAAAKASGDWRLAAARKGSAASQRWFVLAPALSVARAHSQRPGVADRLDGLKAPGDFIGRVTGCAPRRRHRQSGWRRRIRRVVGAQTTVSFNSMLLPRRYFRVTGSPSVPCRARGFSLLRCRVALTSAHRGARRDSVLRQGVMAAARRQGLGRHFPRSATHPADGGRRVTGATGADSGALRLLPDGASGLDPPKRRYRSVTGALLPGSRCSSGAVSVKGTPATPSPAMRSLVSTPG